VTNLPRLTSGGFEIDTDSESFGYLKESRPSESVEELRGRMDEEGYLFLPGFFHRADVAKVRRAICDVLFAEGLIEAPDNAIAKAGIEMYFRPDIANQSSARPLLEELIYGPKMMEFFTGFLGGDAMHYDYTWLRTIAPGKGTYPHCDVVYMGRGTPNVYTAWTPLGDIPLEVGGLILLEGSHKDPELRQTYCRMDVDTACKNRSNESQLNAAGFPGFGALSYDMPEVRRKLGRRLLTAREYKMGDLLIFSIFTVHGSLDNPSREIRISSDSRYQLASEPADERWIGQNPPAHGGTVVKGMIC
jgi:hypothetical protein